VSQQEATTAVDEAVTKEVGDDAAAHVAAVGSLSSEDAQKLQAEGIDKASKLLAQGATPAGRKELAEATGLGEEMILEAVKQLDLMRVKGVGVKYSALLLAAGVETVPDLARRNGANLTEKLAEVNASANICEDLPSQEMVTDWVAQAQDLPRMITY
jgi:predicted flap endonuclease-1-like 5' DNA nuclease